jgi:predicted alpha-1,2-mannosidase
MRSFKNKLILLFCISPLISYALGNRDGKSNNQSLTNWVDPFIGAEIGNTLPGPQLPFGLVRLGPDIATPNNTTGYRSDKPIRGFSHNHLSGTGGGARYGNVMIIPGIGAINLNPMPTKYNEYAKPGFYTVTLHDKAGDVQCELTASNRVGMHRYTFFKLKSDETLLLNYSQQDTIHANILLDASSIINMVEAEQTENIDGNIRIVSDSQIEGFAAFKGGWGGENPYKVYFVATFDRPFYSYGTWKNDIIFKNVSSQSGTNIGAFAGFVLKQKEEIQIKVAISYVSLENAQTNIKEVSGWYFDKVRNCANKVWNDYLNLIEVEGGSPEMKTVFYTALYHTFSMPSYMGIDDENPKWKSGKPHFWDFYTLWDTYRTVMPLYTLIKPEKQSAIVQCLLDIYKHKGWLPDAWTAGDYAYVQGGTSADVVIADAVLKGLKGFDIKEAYEAIKKNTDSMSDNPYKYGRYQAEYSKLGYLSSNIKNGSSRTLEYAYDDYCIAQVARVLGKSDDYHKYLKQSYNSLNLFNPDTKFFWSKDTTGKWVPGFSPTFRRPDYWNGPYFYEGTPWNYSTYFPHDMKLLISKHGENSNFVAFLDTLFNGKHYEMGNEPGFLTPYLYHYAGRPDKSLKQVRELLGDYKVGRLGLPGQDDSGAMSAWYIFGSMGFFPVAGQDVYLIGSPLFSKSTVKLDSGKTFTIIAKNTNNQNLYVQSAKLNGKKWDKCWFRHKDIINGGELVLEMGTIPSEWGTNVPPPSISDLK